LGFASATGSEGLFSDNSRSPLQSSCCRTGNNPIPGPYPHPLPPAAIIENIEVVLGPAGKQPDKKKKFSSAPPGENFAIPARLATE